MLGEESEEPGKLDSAALLRHGSARRQVQGAGAEVGRRGGVKRYSQLPRLACTLRSRLTTGIGGPLCATHHTPQH